MTTGPFTEGRQVPAWWWLVAAAFLFSLVVAFGWYLGLVDAVVVAVLGAAAVAWVLLGWSRGAIRVDDEALQVGRNRLEWQWAGTVTPLDREAATDLLGPGTDPRAFLQIRPWLHEAVRVEITDPADPHPYWVVATRDAERLARAIEARR